MPVPKDPRIAEWLTDQRKAAGYSNVTTLLPELRSAGLGIGYSTWAAFESATGNRAVERYKQGTYLPKLVKFFKTRNPAATDPPTAPPVPLSDTDRVIAAMDRQTLQIKRIADAIRLVAGLPAEEDPGGTPLEIDHIAGLVAGLRARPGIPTGKRSTEPPGPSAATALRP